MDALLNRLAVDLQFILLGGSLGVLIGQVLRSVA
jgi:hypothetical protein